MSHPGPGAPGPDSPAHDRTGMHRIHTCPVAPGPPGPRFTPLQAYRAVPEVPKPDPLVGVDNDRYRAGVFGCDGSHTTRGRRFLTSWIHLSLLGRNHLRTTKGNRTMKMNFDQALEYQRRMNLGELHRGK